MTGAAAEDVGGVAEVTGETLPNIHGGGGYFCDLIGSDALGSGSKRLRRGVGALSPKAGFARDQWLFFC